jgi:hypothetical protein
VSCDGSCGSYGFDIHRGEQILRPGCWKPRILHLQGQNTQPNLSQSCLAMWHRFCSRPSHTASACLPATHSHFSPSIIWSVLAKVQDITLAYLDVPVEARPCVGGSNTATVLVLGSNRAANRPARRIAIYYPFVLTPFAF